MQGVWVVLGDSGGTGRNSPSNVVVSHGVAEVVSLLVFHRSPVMARLFSELTSPTT